MTLEAPLLIDGNDVQVDAFGYYDPEDGCLLRVTINGRDVRIADINRALNILCEDEAGWWNRPLCDEAFNELIDDLDAAHWDDVRDSRS